MPLSDMYPTIFTVIGVLTIISSMLSLYIPYQVAVDGVWWNFTGIIETLYFLLQFVYCGIIMSIAGLVIGISTLRHRKWTWRVNVIFQVISIVIILSILAIPVLLEPKRAFDFITFFRPVSLILAIVILYLLLRTKTSILSNSV